MSTFLLKIELGNSAMQTPEDIALKLKDIADRINAQTLIDIKTSVNNIRDINGNFLGYYEIYNLTGKSDMKTREFVNYDDS